MQTIPGLTEEQILKVIDSIVNQLAPHYIFGYYTLQDIKQEGRIFALEALHRFNPTKGVASASRNSLSDRLYNFLRSHITHRYYNLIRDNYERAEPPNCKCKHCRTNNREACQRYQKFLNRNLTKKLIAGPAQEQIEQSVQQLFGIESQEIINIINQHLPANFRADFRRLIEGIKIPTVRKNQVQEAVLDIIHSGILDV